MLIYAPEPRPEVSGKREEIFADILAARKEEYAMLKHVLTIEAILLLSISGAMAQMSPSAMEAARACRPDIARLCGNVAPGQGRIKACMKAHIRELSDPCKEALFQAWLRE
jgi:hypothetical protein